MVSCQDDYEFIPSQAANHIVGPHLVLHALSDNLQDSVSRGMSEGIVEMLEAVEIDEKDGEG